MSIAKRGNKWHPESCVDAIAVRKLYAKGLSTRQIEARTGISKSYVYKLCEPIARSQSAAAILRQPMKPSKHWRTCRNQARKIMERHLGRKLSRREEVHHKDHDYTNQDLANLIVLDTTMHRKSHRKHIGPPTKDGHFISRGKRC